MMHPMHFIIRALHQTCKVFSRNCPLCLSTPISNSQNLAVCRTKRLWSSTRPFFRHHQAKTEKSGLGTRLGACEHCQQTGLLQLADSHKATLKKFPVSRPPPASISCEHQKFHYFRIHSYSFIISVYSRV